MVISRPRVAVVVPVYGNEQSLGELYERIVKASEDANMELTLQFVNDRSPDNSQAVLKTLAGRDPRVRVIMLSRNHGSFVAIAAGLAQVSDHDAVIVLSADLQDPPEVIPEMVARWRKGKHVILCTRSGRDDPLATRLFASCFYWLFQRIALKDMPSAGFDFFLIDRMVVRVVLESAEKKTSLIGLILWAGFDRAVIEYHRQERKHGKSMWRMGQKLTYAFHSIVAFSSFPMKLFALIGITLTAISCSAIVYVATAALLGNISTQGWASVMVAQLVTITALFLGFGVLGGYLWINLEQTRRRPLFIIEKRLNMPGKSPSGGDGVPLFDLRALSAPLYRELGHAADKSLHSQQIILGPAVSCFEREFAGWLGAKHCIGVANGTDAITLALWGAGIEPGAKVIVPALTAPPTAVAVLRAGCTPVFADVNPKTLTIDTVEIERCAALGCVAVVPVHLYGTPCALVEVMGVAKRLGLTVVEDCAQSTGSLYGGKHCGRFGAVSAFSFYPTKNLGAYGDGGAVVTDDPEIADKLRMMRFYGQNSHGECVLPGFNSRLDEMQAALLSVRLRVLDEHNQMRCEIAALYDRELAFLHPVASVSGRVPHLYVVRPHDRDGFRAHLKVQGVDTGTHYPIPLHKHAFLAAQGIGRLCPEAEKAAARVVSLPCHPGMHITDAKWVVEACQRWRDDQGR